MSIPVLNLVNQSALNGKLEALSCGKQLPDFIVKNTRIDFVVGTGSIGMDANPSAEEVNRMTGFLIELETKLRQQTGVQDINVVLRPGASSISIKEDGDGASCDELSKACWDSFHTAWNTGEWAQAQTL